MKFDLLLRNALRFFVFSSLFFQPPSFAQTPGQVLKVLQLNFNSEMVLEDGDYHIRDRRFTAMVQWINDNKPDIVFIEEGWNYRGFYSITEALALATNYDFAYRVGMGVPLMIADSDGLLVRKGLGLSQTDNFTLPHSGMSFGKGNGWVLSLAANSYAVGGRITLQDGSPMYVYATHLISNADAQDVEAIHADVVKQAKRRFEGVDHLQVLIAGDFNSIPSDPGPKSLINLGYHDTYADAHAGVSSQPEACTSCDDPTSVYFNPMTISPGLFPKQATLSPDHRIDYIFALGPKIKTLASTVVFNQPENHVWMSDHYGVLSTIAVGGNAPAGVKYPNPMRDVVRGDHSLVIHLNDTNLTCDQVEKCTTQFPDAVISAAKGITFINDTGKKVKVTVNGKGHVWPRKYTTLKKTEATTFYFSPGETHRFVAQIPLSRKKLVGTIQSKEMQ